MTKMIIILALLIGLSINTVFGMYADIPEEPEVHFTAKVQDIAYIQKDFSFQLTVYDDRSAYHNSMKPTLLHDAKITAIITPADNYFEIEKLEGKSSKRGYFAASDFVTGNEYESHALYNMTISVQYGDSIDEQTFQFWTITKQ